MSCICGYLHFTRDLQYESFYLSQYILQFIVYYKIVFIARLNKNHKRLHLLIEAFVPLARKYPNCDIELWGPEDCKIYKKELAINLVLLSMNSSQMGKQASYGMMGGQWEDLLKQVSNF